MFSLRSVSILVILFCCLNCKIKQNGKEPKSPSIDSPKDFSTHARIDSVCISEIKWSIDDELPSIFDYYNEEKKGDYTTWSSKLFGRCCSNTDLSFTENLFFNISTESTSSEFKTSSISDSEYLTAFTFNPEAQVNIELYLDFDNSYLDGKYSNRNLLDSNEIIMSPIRLSLINGNVQSNELFNKYGRCKEIDLYVNDEYMQTVILIDTPLAQELTVDAVFKANDTIKLIPKSYYSGNDFDEICISEIQTNLGKIGLQYLNEKFNLMELMNKKD